MTNKRTDWQKNCEKTLVRRTGIKIGIHSDNLLVRQWVFGVNSFFHGGKPAFPTSIIVSLLSHHFISNKLKWILNFLMVSFEAIHIFIYCKRKLGKMVGYTVDWSQGKSLTLCFQLCQFLWLYLIFFCKLKYLQVISIKQGY